MESVCGDTGGCMVTQKLLNSCIVMGHSMWRRQRQVWQKQAGAPRPAKQEPLALRIESHHHLLQAQCQTKLTPRHHHHLSLVTAFGSRRAEDVIRK